MSNILFLPQHVASLKEMMLISKSLKNVKSVFYVSFPISDEVASELANGHSEVITTVNRGELRKKNIPFIAKLKSLLSRSILVKVIINNILFGRIISRKHKKVMYEVERLDTLVKEKNIKKVVLTTDRSTGVELSAAVLAKKMKLELIVVSFAVSAGVNSSAKLRQSKLYFYEKTDSWNTVTLSDGRKLSFFKSYDKKLIESLGIKINNPWVLGSGFCDYMLVDSEREKNRLITMGGGGKEVFYNRANIS